jgi:ADP-ribose pyrophosphatase
MWETVSSKIVHKNKYYSISHEKYILPNGNESDYFILKMDGSSIVIPVKGNKIILERQYRYPIKKWSIELPCGGVEDGSNYLKTAKKELLEEVGYIAGKIKKIGSFFPTPGRSSGVCEVFIASQIKHRGCKNEVSELIKPMELEIKKVYNMVAKGKIIDGLTLSALALARKYLLKN